MSYIDLIFCTTKMYQNIVLMRPLLTNVITISSMARLLSVYLSNQNMSVKYGITVKQMFKFSKNLLKTLIGEKLLNLFL